MNDTKNPEPFADLVAYFKDVGQGLAKILAPLGDALIAVYGPRVAADHERRAANTTGAEREHHLRVAAEGRAVAYRAAERVLARRSADAAAEFRDATDRIRGKAAEKLREEADRGE